MSSRMRCSDAWRWTEGRSWSRCRRGGAAVEGVIGMTVMIATFVLAIDGYRLADTRMKASRAAVTMADYLSREPLSGDGSSLDELAWFLYGTQIGVPAGGAFVASTIGRDYDSGLDTETSTQVWCKRTTAVGPDPEDLPYELAEACGRTGAAGEAATLPGGDLELAEGEVVVMAEICLEVPIASLVSGRLRTALATSELYHHYLLPARDVGAIATAAQRCGVDDP